MFPVSACRVVQVLNHVKGYVYASVVLVSFVCGDMNKITVSLIPSSHLPPHLMKTTASTMNTVATSEMMARRTPIATAGTLA